VISDFDVDVSEDLATATAYKNDQRNIRKIKEATQKLQINIIHPLRESKRLLVLDIDYSSWFSLLRMVPFSICRLAILDTKPLTSGSLPPAECARPHLHEFLESVHPYYDICIW
jgi:ubiquitin-like domain-containing CTD phosphatase 1